MNQKNQSAESKVKEIRRHTRKKYSAEEKIRIVIEGLRGESSIAELCRKEGINANLYYNWSKDFLEAGKRRLAGDIKREATTTDISQMLGHSNVVVTEHYLDGLDSESTFGINDSIL
jgi:transposase